MRIFKRRNTRFVAIFALCLLWEGLSFSVFALEHIVKKGDTLYSLSRTYGLSVDEICRANKIEMSSVLKADQRLVIPVISENKKYAVQKGDTLYSIARVNGMTVDELRKLNGLSEDSTLKAGQILQITPSAVASSAAPIVANTPKPTTTTKTTTVTTPQKQTSIQWPVQTSSVTYVNGKISGVQLAAKENESVVAINSGTVIYSGIYRGYGNVVLVKNQSGYMYVYTGMGNLNVNPGKEIISGDVLGTVGIDSESGRSQLILMVYQKD
jgi:murein DD-endopeptidase MepM/ murein hydrolase activator NlpD